MNKKLLIAFSLISALANASSTATVTTDNCCSSVSDDCNSCARKCSVECAQSINLWQPHAFSAYSSRDILQKRTFFTNESHREEGYQGFFSVAMEYMQNFGQKCNDCKNLGARPFWSGTNTMTYGSNNGESNIDAYQFGMGNLADGETGTIQLNTKVQHVGADMLLYFTRRKNERGFFFSLKAPLGAMSVRTKLTEVVASPNNVPDYQWLTYPAPAARYKTLTEAWQAGESNSTGDEVSSSRHKLLVINKGRISDCKMTTIRMADLTGVFGYKAWASDKGFLDIGFKVSTPTGNVPQGDFVLEPIFGRAGHWGVGGEVTFHYKAWESQEGNKGIDVWMQGDAMHLFNGRQPNWRTFDLKKNGPGSKYLLLQHYTAGNPTDGAGALNPSGVNPTGFVASFVTNAANVTTMPVHSTFAVEGTAALAFDMYYDNWNFLIGGEFWGRSKECLKFNCCNQLVKERVANLNDYAVLGRQISEDASYINGNAGAATTPATNQAGTLFYLNLCQPDATINKSENRATAASIGLTNFTRYPIAPGSDTPSNSYYLNADAIPAGLADARLPENRIPASLNEALDVAGASASSAMTGKLFGQFGYTWKEHHYTPNLAVIGGAEFQGKGNNAVNLWSVGLQGSVNF
jgi:hypothetical protein